ncbi:MAG TPA: ABC transporter permease [Gemmatimonadales bacterium]|jgi:putative ABC transport system permease protein|nr:ABC transporter permease [Gemmatimonadales bacterium]
MSQFLQNLRFSVRSLLRSPVLTGSVVVTLALCIAATTAIFSVVHAVLFRPLPFARPGEILLVWTTWKDLTSGFSAGNWGDVDRQQRSFRYFVPAHDESFNLAGAEAPENVDGARVGADYFAMLGVQPALGRTFLAEEDAPGGGDVVILSDGLWRRRFGADPSVVGREVRLDGRPHRVVGVMPASMDYAVFDEELWVPAAFSAERLAMHDEHYLSVFARLNPGVTRAQAEAEMGDLAGWLRTTYPKENRDRGIVVGSFVDELVGDYRPRLFVLLGAVAFVLLIACANIANLLLARGAARSREMAIRAAIGAGRGHLLRQALTESLVLAVLGGLVGVLAGYWGVSLLAAYGPEDVPRLAQARVDGPVLAFALGITVLSGLVFGLAPALRMSARPPHEALKEGGRGGSRGGGRDRLRNVLVIGEIALALVLLTGAGLLIRSAIALNDVDPGFDPRGVLTGRVSLPAVAYETPEQVVRTFERLEQRLAAAPGVAASALVSAAPLESGGSNGLVPEGRPLDISSAINSLMRLVTPGYFATMRIRLVRGRTFTAEDRRGAPLVMVINETLAREAFPGQDPVGKRIACCEPGPDGSPNWKEVVGVVSDVHAQGLDQAPVPEFYLPMVQAPAAAWTWTDRTMTVAVRAQGEATSLMGPLRKVVAEVDPALPLYNLGTMTGRVTDSLAQSRFSTMLLTAFGAIALLLAAIGVYGIISYGVTQRSQEIGIRMALGARQTDVLGMVVRHGAVLAGIGLTVGLAGALALSGLLSSLLFRISPTDPPTFAGGMVVLTAVAVLAAALPARRAARTDPVVALRSE